MFSQKITLSKSLKTLIILSCLGPLAGCATVNKAVEEKPVIAEITEPNQELRRLPAPRKKTTVSVYDMEDLTGQFKERDNIQSLSKAVTQGGSSILVQALKDAGERRWFTVLERKKLDNLLKERQIVTEMRRLYRNEQRIDPKVLPPLMHAGILIEGAIIGYDTNVVTGGAGARFLAIGADAKYVQDVVTVTLQAISVKTGEVLTSVTTRKSVASYSLQGGAFRYVKLDELLELEAGTTYNEPKQIAVESAIEKAVLALIIEGADLKIWQFADPSEGARIISEYQDEKYGDHLTVAATNRPSPEMVASLAVAKTHPKRVRAPRATQARSQRPATKTKRKSSPKVQATPQPQATQTKATSQTNVRRIPSAQQQQSAAPRPATPQRKQEPILPPAPSDNEPAVGSIEMPETTSEKRTLLSFIFGVADSPTQVFKPRKWTEAKEVAYSNFEVLY